MPGRGSAAGGRGLEAGQRSALAARHAGPRREVGDAQHPGLARGVLSYYVDKKVFLLQLTDTGTFICFATGRHADLAGAEVSVYLLVEQRECRVLYLLIYCLFIE